MKRIITVVAALAFIGYAALGIHQIVSRENRIQLNEVKLRSTTSELIDLQLKFDQLNSNLETELHKNTTDEQKVKSLESEKQDLQKQKEDLEKQLQGRLEQKAADKARADALAAKAVNAVTGSATAYAAGGDDKMFIYMHESGNNPGSINSGSGACGLGQALPCSKMPCSLSDYGCQDAYFTQYMQNRYGTWANARAFWQANRWW